ncbi:16891_t:CDS:1 [Funneliformis mosseae]|uniref:16891_t:CDS:1 n=1 Tax=Funneliformis mosseae TaxID=27381 RepID=A0A9N9DRP4_FUNMO|nr:16891_t:CDS:1 [Funneliformis mosseae]
MSEIINTFVWEIGSFQDYVKSIRYGKYIQSHIFRIPQRTFNKEQGEEGDDSTDSTTLWRLLIYPNGYTASNHISLYLEAIKTPYEIIKGIDKRNQIYHIGIGISNTSLNFRLSRDLIHQRTSNKVTFDLSKESPSWGFNKFISLDSIFPVGDKSKKVELFIQVTILDDKPVEKEKYYGQLEKWFEYENFTDVEFILDCGSRIKAHRIILASNSEYFRNMLQGGWKEQHMKSIPIKETRFEIFRTILYYLYSGKLMDTSLVTLCDVFRQGDMMMLDDMKALIARKLKKLINEDIWDEILLLAWETKDLQLKNIGLEYAMDNWERVKKRKRIDPLICNMFC